MERIFKIEWPDHLGPEWMNEHNLRSCIKNFCSGVEGIKVRDITIATKRRPDCAILDETCVDCKEKCPFSHNLP